MVHIILALSVFVAFLLRDKKGLLMAFIIIFLFAALRYDFGNDYMSYLENFELIKNTDINPFGTQTLFYFLNTISPTFFIFILITSVLTIYPVYFIIKNNMGPEYYAFAVFIFVINPYIFLMNLSAMRQALATMCFIIAVQFSVKKKIIPYVLMIIIASLFHKSAIVLLPFYFWINEKRVKNWHIVTIVVSILVLLLMPENLYNIIIEVLEIFNDKNYDYYFEKLIQNSLRATFLSSLYLIYLLINIKKLSGKTLLYTKLYLVGCVFVVLAYNLSMLTRMQMYFDIFSVVALPGIIEHNYKNNNGVMDQVINVYAFPALLFVIYILRYYSFFNNPTWESFTVYNTIFGV